MSGIESTSGHGFGRERSSSFRGNNDGGIDIRGRLYCMNFVIQCKAWVHPIGPKIIRELDGALTQLENSGAIGIVVIPDDGRFSFDAVIRAKMSVHYIILTKEGSICEDLKAAYC
ncbi:20681_t:CDS:2 [Cetraspora pellucida]|uniref:20681_t:CDS:1 n=1 Tax=Cetraspora pellucida TaxID=1433469 RepID=A0A9N9ICL4_9GLOM|nr:20681_t:CDS:2 [Cetraspora pellucida]